MGGQRHPPLQDFLNQCVGGRFLGILGITKAQMQLHLRFCYAKYSKESAPYALIQEIL